MRPRWSLRFVALVCASMTLSAVLPVGHAWADSVADKRAEAAKLAAQLEADNRLVDSLTARYEAAQLAAANLDAQIARSSAALEATKAHIAQTGVAVRDIAVAEFVNGGPTLRPAAAVFDQADVRAATLAQFFSDLAVQDAQQVLDANKAAQQDYQLRLDDLRTQQKRARAVAASLRTAQSAAASAAAEQQSHLSKVQGDLAGLVAAEQARARAAREAQTRATVSQNVLPPPPSVARPRSGSSPGTRPAPPVDANRAATAVAEARRQLGKPYQWGAAGPDSFDCSGLTMWAWRAAGVTLDHYTGSQYNATTHIPLSELQPGDLVFFYSDLSHVGIYVGDGQMIHAPHAGEVVRYSSIYGEGSPIYAGRVTG